MSAFRGFREADLPEVERMVLALYEEDPCPEPMTPAKIRTTARELSSHPDKGEIVVFEAGGSIVGYAIVAYRWSNECGGDIAHVDELYVKPAWRGKGIASAFLEHAAGMRSGGVRGVQLEAHPENVRALALYRARGFEPVGNVWLFRKSGGPRPCDGS